MTYLRFRTLLLFTVCLLPMAAAAIPWTFSVAAVSGDFAAGPHHFGTHDDAQNGLDAYDVPEPPLPPSDYLALALRMAEPSELWPDRWHDEFRARHVFDDELEIWGLALETDRLGEPIILTVTLIEGLPSLAEVFLLTDAGRTRMEFPTSLTLTPTADLTMLWLEVHVHGSVPATAAGVSEVKRMFR